jgi:hypothetical protein
MEIAIPYIPDDTKYLEDYDPNDLCSKEIVLESTRDGFTYDYHDGF